MIKRLTTTAKATSHFAGDQSSSIRTTDDASSAFSFHSRTSHAQPLSSTNFRSDAGSSAIFNNVDDVDDDEHEEEENEFNKLEFHNSSNFVGREDELERLNSIYARMCQTNSVTSDDSTHNGNKTAQLVLIDGHSGTGKSNLVERFIEPLLLRSTPAKHAARKDSLASANSKNTTTRRPCNFCQGKYDQYNAGGTLTAVADAFSSFCSALAESTERQAEQERLRVVQRIRRRMDTTRRDLLASIVTGLKELLGKNPILPSNTATEKSSDDRSLFSQGLDNSHRISISGRHVSATDAPYETLTVTGSRDAVWSQILYGFKVLIRVLGTKSQPLVLYLDDLQWADQHSLDLITELLLDASIQNLLIIGSYRSNEVHDVPGHRLNQAMPKWKKLKSTIHTISLHNLTEHQVSSFLSKLLNLEIKETESLAAILQHKTDGNIYYIIQALVGLRRKQILTRNMNTLKWTWDDQQASKEISLAANIVDLITSKLHSLPKELQQCLMVASFLRSTFNQAILEALVERERCFLGQNYGEILVKPSELESVLDLAVKEGLLERTKKQTSATNQTQIPLGDQSNIDNCAIINMPDQVATANSVETDDNGNISSQASKQKTILRFAHDRIQQAAFSLVLPGELEQMRHRMGKHLLEIASDPLIGENWMWFVAADQFESNSDLPISEHIIPVLDLIRLLVKVGEMATTISAFLPASKYLQRALRLLETGVDDPWGSENELSRQVYRSLSEVEMYLGNYEVGEQLCTTMLEHVDEVSERIAVHTSLGMALNRDGQYAEGVKMLMGALRLLKSFPQRFHVFHLIKDASAARGYLNKYTDDEIMNLPKMENKRMEYTMNLLRHLVHGAYNAANIPLAILVTLRQVRYTFEYGLTKESASAFSTYACLLLNVLKQNDAAKRTSALAMRMMAVMNSKNADAHTVLTLGSFVSPWWDPIHKTLEVLQKGHRSGMESGELESGYLCWSISLISALVAGIPLNQIHKTGLNCLAQMDHYRVTSAYKCYRYTNIMIEYLMGTRAQGTSSPMWKEFQDLPPLRSIKHKDHPILEYCCWGLMQLATYFGELETAEDIIPAFKKTASDEFAYIVETVRLFHCGLTYSRLVRKTGKRKYIRYCKKEIREIKSLIQSKRSPNSIHRYMLMQADLLAVTEPNDTEAVKASYDKAISYAARSGVIHDCALGNELAGEYFLSKLAKLKEKDQPLSTRSSQIVSEMSHLEAVDDGDDFWPKQYLSNAIKLYEEWGAMGKVAQMKSKYGDLLDISTTLRSSNARSRGARQKLHSTNTRTCLATAHEMFAHVNLEEV